MMKGGRIVPEESILVEFRSCLCQTLAATMQNKDSLLEDGIDLREFVRTIIKVFLTEKSGEENDQAILSLQEDNLVSLARNFLQNGIDSLVPEGSRRTYPFSRLPKTVETVIPGIYLEEYYPAGVSTVKIFSNLSSDTVFSCKVS